jgi:hypothetical protein
MDTVKYARPRRIAPNVQYEHFATVNVEHTI